MRIPRKVLLVPLSALAVHLAAACARDADEGRAARREPHRGRAARLYPVSLEGGAVTLRLPDDVAALPRDEVLREFADGDSSVHVFANPSESVLVVIGPLHVAPAEARGFMEGWVLERKAEVEWIAHGYVRIGGERWVHLEFTHRLGPQLMHQHLLAAPFRGRTLLVAIAAPESQYARYRDAIGETIRSLRLRAPPASAPG